MVETDEALIGIVDAAIADCLKHASGNSNHAIIPVRCAARAVAAAVDASEAELPRILQLVCERSIRRGHALAFAPPGDQASQRSRISHPDETGQVWKVLSA